MNSDLNEEQLRALYTWIDNIPLSRPKRNIARDFSDGVLLAEIISVYFPSMVELHNYSAANSVQQKMYNFDTLNTRVLKKLGFQISRSTIDDVVKCKAGAIENVLNSLQIKMAKYREKMVNNPNGGGSPSSVRSPRGKNNNNNNINNSKNSGMRDKDNSRDEINQDRSVFENNNRINNNNGQQQQNRNNNNRHNSQQAAVDEELLMEKEQEIRYLKGRLDISERKINKLEAMLKIKDDKIKKLSR